MKKHNLLRNAVHFALTAGVATTGGVAFAADDVAEQDKITVTGSRIQRVDIEGPAPVTVISREDIDASGDISVAEVLRGSTFNSFGSFKPSSGSSAQSQAVVSLRGLGSGRTLVLLDGRRVANAPAFSGTGQNLNTLPLAAVERIEILRDSASAIYGSDAIGGVINIILRKDYEGLNIRAGVGRPTRDGGDEATGSLVGGISSARGNLIFSLEHDEQGMIFNGNREFSKVGTSSFGFLGSYFASGPGGESLGTFPDARCPDRGPGAAPAFDGSAFQDSDVSGSLCRFNYARTSANEASIRKDSLFINGTFEVSDDTQFFARTTFTRTDSFGRYAPTPVVGATPFLPTMAASNPNNPSIGQQVDTDGDGTADFTGPFDLSLFYRNVPGGFRDSLVDDIFIDAVAGFQGSIDLFGGADWELAAQHSRATTSSIDFGFVNSLTLQSAIDSGGFDIFNVQGGIPAGVNPATGTDPASLAFQAAARSFRVDGFVNNLYTYKGFDGQISFDVFQMENGAVPLVLGFDYADEKYGQDYDAVQNAGTVAGSAGGNDTAGSRSRYSIFAETQIPLHDMFAMNAALRYDSYSGNVGTSIVPKVGFEFRPMDTLLVRAGYGEGFRAPTLNNLFSTGGQSFNAAVDTLRCRSESTGMPGTGVPGDPCRSTQYQNVFGGNPNLKPEESESWGVGFVWNPTADFSASVDYYDIEFTKQITNIPLQQILNNEANGIGPGGTNNVTRAANGNILLVNAALTNLSGIKTDGLDVNAVYRFSLGESWGDFALRLDASKVLNYETEVNPGSGFVSALAGVANPDLRGNLGLSWTGGDFGANIVAEHITDTKIGGSGTGFASWNPVHVQFTYDTPWNGKVTVGARNVFDRDPPLNTTVLDHPYYSNQLHDVYGRVPYIRYEQDL